MASFAATYRVQVFHGESIHSQDTEGTGSPSTWVSGKSIA
jgi:hypothetical protein